MGFAIVLLITWPDRRGTQFSGSARFSYFAGVIISYPFSKTIWLAIDLMFRR